MDIVISAAVAILSIVMAYLGIRVTLHPPGTNAITKRYKVGFFFCATLTVFLVVWQGFRTTSSQAQFSRDITIAKDQASSSNLNAKAAKEQATSARTETENMRLQLQAEGARRRQAEKDLTVAVEINATRLSKQMSQTESALNTNINTYRTDTTNAVSRLVKPDRHLSEVQKQAIHDAWVKVVCSKPLEEKVKYIPSVVWEPNGEAAEYAADFIESLDMKPGCAFGGYRKELRAIGKQIVGVIIVTPDWNNPSPFARAILEAVHTTGIAVNPENGSTRRGCDHKHRSEEEIHSLCLALMSHEINVIRMRCPICHNALWVCEDHMDRPWGVAGGCQCGGAGAPCPACNPCDREHAPKMPEGYRSITGTTESENLHD